MLPTTKSRGKRRRRLRSKTTWPGERIRHPPADVQEDSSPALAELHAAFEGRDQLALDVVGHRGADAEERDGALLARLLGEHDVGGHRQLLAADADLHGGPVADRLDAVLLRHRTRIDLDLAQAGARERLGLCL